MAKKDKNKVKEPIDKAKVYAEFVAPYEEQGYTAVADTISIEKANKMAFVTAGPVVLFCFLVYGLVVWVICDDLTFNRSFINVCAFVAGILISIPLHEMFHGLGWMLVCDRGYKNISFGIMREYLTPYCHCKVPLSLGAYLFGGLLPFFILGIWFFLAALILHNGLFLAFSLFNILAAGGDTAIALNLLKYRGKDVQILDHPTECGFIVLSKSQS